MDGPNPDSVPVRTVVEKTVLLGEDDYDHDHINKLGHGNPWQDCLNESQHSKLNYSYENTSRHQQWMMNLRETSSDRKKISRRYKRSYKNINNDFERLLVLHQLRRNLLSNSILNTYKWTNEIRSNQGYVRPKSVEKRLIYYKQALADGVITESQASRFSQVLLTPKAA